MRAIRYVVLWTCLGAAGLPSADAAEGRRPVYLPGTVITEPGRYVLTRNVTATGAGPVVEIAAPNVELDLNGFAIDNSGGTYGILVSWPAETVIRNGEIRGASVGVEIPDTGGHRAVLEDLRIHAPSIAGVRIAGVQTVTIRRVFVNLSSGDGIKVDGGGGFAQARIESCQIARTTGVGIWIAKGRGIAIVDSHVDLSSLEGIRVDGTIGGTVRGNQVSAAAGSGGIALSAARGVAVERNVVSQSRAHGIFVGGSSSDTLVVDNLSWGNGTGPGYGDGIRVESQRAIVVGNVLNENNGVGLHFAAGSAYGTIGRNRARDNQNLAGAVCSGTPSLFPPNSCHDGLGDLTTFGDNLIPGPALF